MMSFDDAVALAAAPDAVTDSALRTLVADRVHDWSAMGLLDLTHLLIVEPGDTEEALVNVIGFSPLVNPIDGKRYETEGFAFPFDYIEDHGCWFELFVTIGNSGFAFVLFVWNTEGTIPELLSLCRRHSEDNHTEATRFQ